MKDTRIRIAFRIFLLLSAPGFLWGLPARTLAQEQTDTTARPEPTEISPGLNFTYLCTSNDSALLTAQLSYRKDRDMIGLENAVIEFGVSSATGTKSLGTSRTDSTGTARLTVFTGTGQPANAEGVITWNASFGGQGKYQPAAETFQAKPAVLRIEFIEVDSVRTVKVTATQAGKNGEAVPIAGQSVKLYVPSLFRPLPIGEISLDDSGTGTMEFPKTLVGDSSGNVIVVAQIEENDLFGNVQGRNTVNWAIPKHLIPQEKPTRELWTPVAPVWMIITLIIMLSGVWAHYVYAVIQMIRIKRSSKVNTYSDRY